jgi:glyoxylase-like metal-dependent hydrolase (beta-lactamase superfamily II)
LFSGDHILNGSTTVVDPPDGNMNAYMTSLEKLKAICIAEKIEFILPAHGYVLGNTLGAPFDAIEHIHRLIQHRLKREAKIKSVIVKDPQGDLSSWVKVAYDDVPERVWPAAKRSLSAHVERLVELGLGFELSESAKAQMAQTLQLNLDH